MTYASQDGEYHSSSTNDSIESYLTPMNTDRWIHALDFAGRIHPQLRVSQLKFLFIVDANPDRSLSELSELMGVTLPAISRAIDVFGTKKNNRARDLSIGFIETSPSRYDDRIKTVKMTSKGKHFLNSFTGIFNDGLQT